ncbi:flagellar hook-basal body protein [Cohnella lubricantis]|uniref:Flagellar hook-basal body protein n=1 Tax=Cohnella lubricantis TaxID=2163172 RepID=A0A841TEV8_9BACL|nr:flagellar hook-basal body protein [Cohnella lubricantis]MBB6679562.1 flagellar hook-basal body protein [Cohnella lubricantis]MBP2117836.1 flagellar basal-body rod protein FlgG [Cohnella lubricantis]
MLRGLYTAASGMIAQQRRHDTVTNNIANLNTPGFKVNNTANRAFPEMLLSAIGGENAAQGPIGRLNTGVFAEENLLGMTQGDMMETDRSQDMAIASDIRVDGVTFDASGKSVDEDGNVTYQPQAFFTVQTPDGEQRYTRNGSFQTAADGTLVNADGLPVLGADGQPIVVQGSWDDVTVTSDGRLLDQNTGLPLDGDPQLMLTRVNNPNELIVEGNSLFRYAGEPDGIVPVQAGDGVEIRQGFLERSNVDASQSMVDLMSALRAYEANQKVIQYYDSSLDKAVNDVGKI